MTLILLLVASVYLFVKLVKKDILYEKKRIRVLLMSIILLFWIGMIALLVIFSMAAWANEHTYLYMGCF